MIRFWRTLFGLGNTTGERKVVGSTDKIDAKNLPYIQDSNRRLKELHELSNRYRNTPHGKKIRAVYLKTKRIHFFFITRSRGPELEMFHLQHTDHFLSTFRVILEVHQLQQEPDAAAPEATGRRIAFDPVKKKQPQSIRQHREVSEEVYNQLLEAATYIPILGVPEISINTYSRIRYYQNDAGAAQEIGYSSTAEEKEAFVQFVSDRLGIDGVSYVGNALVKLQTGAAGSLPETVPVIRWNGSAYALCLSEERLYPVITFRKMR